MWRSSCGGKIATLHSSSHPGLLKRVVIRPKNLIEKVKASLGVAWPYVWPILSAEKAQYSRSLQLVHFRNLSI